MGEQADGSKRFVQLMANHDGLEWKVRITAHLGTQIRILSPMMDKLLFIVKIRDQ
jgi:hypothetical protein